MGPMSSPVANSKSTMTSIVGYEMAAALSSTLRGISPGCARVVFLLRQFEMLHCRLTIALPAETRRAPITVTARARELRDHLMAQVG